MRLTVKRCLGILLTALLCAVAAAQESPAPSSSAPESEIQDKLNDLQRHVEQQEVLKLRRVEDVESQITALDQNIDRILLIFGLSAALVLILVVSHQRAQNRLAAERLSRTTREAELLVNDIRRELARPETEFLRISHFLRHQLRCFWDRTPSPNDMGRVQQFLQSPDLPVSLHCMALALVAEYEKRWESAVAALEQIREFDSEDPFILFHLANVHAQIAGVVGSQQSKAQHAKLARQYYAEFAVVSRLTDIPVDSMPTAPHVPSAVQSLSGTPDNPQPIAPSASSQTPIPVPQSVSTKPVIVKPASVQTPATPPVTIVKPATVQTPAANKPVAPQTIPGKTPTIPGAIAKPVTPQTPPAVNKPVAPQTTPDKKPTTPGAIAKPVTPQTPSAVNKPVTPQTTPDKKPTVQPTIAAQSAAPATNGGIPTAKPSEELQTASKIIANHKSTNKIASAPTNGATKPAKTESQTPSSNGSSPAPAQEDLTIKKDRAINALNRTLGAFRSATTAAKEKTNFKRGQNGKGKAIDFNDPEAVMWHYIKQAEVCLENATRPKNFWRQKRLRDRALSHYAKAQEHKTCDALYFNWGIALVDKAMLMPEEQRESYYHAAIDKFLAGHAISPKRFQFPLATLYAIAGESEQCRTWLKRSDESGTLDKESLRDAPDFERVRGQPWFSEFIS